MAAEQISQKKPSPPAAQHADLGLCSALCRSADFPAEVAHALCRSTAPPMVLGLWKPAVADLSHSSCSVHKSSASLKGSRPASSPSEHLWGWFAPASSGECCRHVFQRAGGCRLLPKDSSWAIQHPTMYSIVSGVSLHSNQQSKPLFFSFFFF